MADSASLAAEIIRRAGTSPRFIVAIAGPPGAGKSTLSAELKNALEAAGETAAVVPMDGFHLDDVILNARGHRSRKGAHHTFDAAGFLHLLRRIRSDEPEIYLPVFDRKLELSRAAADVVDRTTRVILVEGLYLLLRRPPWNELKPLFDLSIFLDVPKDKLVKRLTGRILSHGFDETYARNWIDSNDLLNVDEVQLNSSTSDIVVSY